MGDIYRSAAYGNAVESGLNNRVLLSMETSAQFMAFAGRHIQLFPETGLICTVRDVGRRAVVARGEDSFIHHDDGSDAAADASAAASEPSS